MNNNFMIIDEKEDESDISSSTNNDKKKCENQNDTIEENEKEIELNECSELNLTESSIISLEKQINLDIASSELISIKQFRNLLGIFGHFSTNFIVERLYQVLIRISSKKYQHVSSDLTKNNFLNYLSILNNSTIHHEIYYLFFDITNKGYITKNDFINVVNHMCETICEFVHKNPKMYKEYISNLYDYLLRINVKEYVDEYNSQQWISRSKFIKLIESGTINFYDIMNIKNFGNIIKINQKQYGIFKDIMYSIKDIKKKIIQKENIESNLSIITGNYLDNIGLIKDEYKEMKIQNDINNNSFSVYNNIISNSDKPLLNESMQINLSLNKENNNKYEDIQKNITFNKRNTLNPDILCNNFHHFFNNSSISVPKISLYNKMKSPQERILIDENNNDENENEISLNSSEENENDEESNYKYLKEEKEDSVNEMDDIKSIKNIENIKKMSSIKLNINKENSLNKNNKNLFFFLKPFKIKNDKELEKELKKNNIDINNSLILLKKDNFVSYLETIENCFLNEINDINISNNIPNILKDGKTSIILNKPLKEKEIYEKELKFENSLNNTNMEIMYAIILGIEKCISALGDYDLQDKNYIISLLTPEDLKKTTRKRNKTLIPSKNGKNVKNNNNNELYEAISNYPFKKHQYIFEEINTFHYNYYTMDNKGGNDIICNKIEICEYSPQIFCNIRYKIGEITNKDFLHSFNVESLISNLFLGNINNLNQLLTINKDNFPEFIMFSSDTKYIIKCITQNEFEVLQKYLPNYYEYLMKSIVKNIIKINSECHGNNTNTSTYSSSSYIQLVNNIEAKYTLLDIIYGIYSVNLFDKKIFFIIKKNIFYSYNNLLITKKYDLKGSSIDRKFKNKKNSDVYKDLDYLEFKQKLNLSTKMVNYLSEILGKDTSFLSENNIINYSFYIGIAEINENSENEENDQGILSSDKNCMYYFGISDIFTEYGTGKKMEYIFKTITKGNGISAIPPNEYKIRFDKFINFCLK